MKTQLWIMIGLCAAGFLANLVQVYSMKIGQPRGVWEIGDVRARCFSLAILAWEIHVLLTLMPQ